MKAIVVHEFCGSLDDIRVSDVPRPQPRTGEILIRVVAAGVNFVDILYVRAAHFHSQSAYLPIYDPGILTNIRRKGCIKTTRA